MSILNLAYNQLATHLSVCTDTGYIVYSLKNNIEKTIYREKDGGVGIMKSYYKTNIITLVGGGDNPFRSKDTLILWDEKTKNPIVQFDLTEPIRNVLICKDKLIVVLSKKVCVFNFDGSLLDSKTTYSNDKGLCAINLEEEIFGDDKKKSILALPGTHKGELDIWQLNTELSRTIPAHDSNLSAIAMNAQGTLVATASETGTLIRVFNTETGEQVHEFRRGSLSATIYDICFDLKSTYLACCSSNGTVHIYDMTKETLMSKNTKSTLSALGEYLSYFDSQWGYKQIKINSTARAICAFDENNVLHVTTFDGTYYRISGEQFENVSQSNLFIGSQ